MANDPLETQLIKYRKLYQLWNAVHPGVYCPKRQDVYTQLAKQLGESWVATNMPMIKTAIDGIEKECAGS